MRKKNPQGGTTAPAAGADPETLAGTPPDRPATAAASGSGPAGDPATDAVAAVAGYLRAHPKFFDEHPDVLADLNLSHLAAGGVVSLVERQVRVLRGQLHTERARLAQLIARAREYESFSARLHALVLALIGAPDLARVAAVLEDGLTREFSAQAVTLRIFPVDAGDGTQDPVLGAFRDFLERRHALCGPLDEAKGAVLFGVPEAGGEPVRCAALVPVQAHGRCGVLAIGATDPERFSPDMRTDLLDRLGEIVGRKLEMLPAEFPPLAAAPVSPVAAAPVPPATVAEVSPEVIAGDIPGATPGEIPDAIPAAPPETAPKPRRRRTKKTTPE